MRTLTRLLQAIEDYDDAAAARWAAAAIEDGTEPDAILAAVSETMNDIGEAFSAGELWLPDLVAAASATRAGLDVVEAYIAKRGEKVERLGTVVLGTVAGDLHSIGRSIVGAFLTATGFRVIDLGTDVPCERFIAAVQQHNAGLVAMSALLTTTMVEQKRVIEALAETGVRDRVKVLVGGGAITPEFAAEIGADGYAATAPEAARRARILLGV